MRLLHRKVGFALLLASLPLANAHAFGFDVIGAVGTMGKMAKGATKVDLQEELAMGRQFSGMILGAFAPSHNAALNTYVSQIGLTVAQASVRPDMDYHFQVISARDSSGAPIVNAFSTPGGFIFITEGLIKSLNSEAALAGVLAHEVAHVAEKHVIKEIHRNNVKSGLLELGGNVASSAGGVAGEISSVLSSALVSNLFEKGLDKGDEYRADAAAVAYVSKAGYDPRGLVIFLQTIEAKEGKNYSTLLRTHPKPQDRIARIEKLIKDKKISSEGKQTLADRWKRSS